ALRLRADAAVVGRSFHVSIFDLPLGLPTRAHPLGRVHAVEQDNCIGWRRSQEAERGPGSDDAGLGTFSIMDVPPLAGNERGVAVADAFGYGHDRLLGVSRRGIGVL